jgi:hypothetical protein
MKNGKHIRADARIRGPEYNQNATVIDPDTLSYPIRVFVCFPISAGTRSTARNRCRQARREADRPPHADPPRCSSPAAGAERNGVAY